MTSPSSDPLPLRLPVTLVPSTSPSKPIRAPVRLRPVTVPEGTAAVRETAIGRPWPDALPEAVRLPLTRGSRSARSESEASNPMSLRVLEICPFEAKLN